MALDITKDSIDLGIVTKNTEAMLGFYRDVLGLPPDALPQLEILGGTMYRFLAGGSCVKLLDVPTGEGENPPGGIGGGTGMRYFTITVSNLDAATAAAGEAGCKIPVPPNDLRPGVRISMIEDPDGNWVELLQMG